MEFSIQKFLQEQVDDGFGVRELSRKTGVASSTISRILNGKVSPDIETCEKILKPFGCELRIAKPCKTVCDTRTDPKAADVPPESV